MYDVMALFPLDRINLLEDLLGLIVHLSRSCQILQQIYFFLKPMHMIELMTRKTESISFMADDGLFCSFQYCAY